MEEIDSIILHFLRQLDIDINDDVEKLSDLQVETIFEATSKCITTINPALKIPSKLPSGISQRIEDAAHVASICKDLGYKNDVGYQTFLYFNEADLRQVFMFLIESLPNEGKQSIIDSKPTEKKSLLYQSIGAKIGEELNSIWIPACCTSRKKYFGDFAVDTLKTNFNLSCDEKAIIQTIMLGIQNKANIQESNSDVNQIQTKQENKSKANLELVASKSLKELKEIAIVQRQKLDVLESEKNVVDLEYAQAQKSCEKLDSDYKNIQSILETIGITDIESGVSGNVLENLQKKIDKLHRKSEEWTSKNLSLKVELNKVLEKSSLSGTERNKCKNALLALKDTAKSMKEEYYKKDELRNQLQQNYKKLTSGHKRSMYTKRIMEIIGNVDKQNMEVSKILKDTRQIQKEINSLEGQLDRCFSLADETLFRDAKKDDQSKKAYKLLALLHSECNTIVSLVNETGILKRDAIDLEDNIESEKAKRTEDILKKIQSDLTAMQEEENNVA